MPSLNRFTRPLWDLDTFHVWDDFWWDQTDLSWVDTVTDTGTALVGDATRGIMTLTPSDATVADNDEVYLASANQLFLFAAGRPLYAKCRLSFVETAAGVYNAFFGFMSGVAANALVDDGGGMRASGCLACIYKVDGGTVWRCTARNGSTVTDTVSTKAAGGAAYQELEVIGESPDQVNMTFTYKVDGEFLKDANGLVIRHTVPIASASIMSVAAGAKLGAITNNDVLNLDYIYAAQRR
jgi:hypothetical protein